MDVRAGVRPATRRTASRSDRQLILAVAVVGAVLGALSGAEPTTWGPADVLWNGAVAGAIVWIASYGRRWSWIASAAIAGVASSSPMFIGIAVVTLAAATWIALRVRRRRLYGALLASPVVFLAFRLPTEGFHGLATIVGCAIVTPLVLSGIACSSKRVQKRIGRLAVALTLLVIVAAVLVAVAAMQTRSRVLVALDRVEEAVDALQDDDDLGARELFALAVEEFREANETANGLWVQPGRAVPVLGQHTAALQVLTEQGELGAEQAELVLASLDREALSMRNGAVDFAAITALEQPFADLTAVVSAADRAVARVENPWLVFPVADRLTELREELADAEVRAGQVTDAVAVAPSMLGAAGERSYLILFTTPAELRGAGGLVGNWVELSAVDGRVTVEDVGRNEDLNETLRARGVELSGPPDFLERYGVFQTEEYFQDVTLSPDFPTVARVAAELYERATARSVDAVAMVDPAAMAGLLQLTGPVEVLGRQFTAGGLESFLLTEQYSAFASEEERVLFLALLSEATFSALLTADVPDPLSLDDSLGDVVAQDRLVIWSSHLEEQARLERLGLSGEFPTDFTGDAFALVGQNSSQNKIDSFLQRSTTYDVELDPVTGVLRATVRIQLTNSAPAEGLPDAVIGNNDQGLPFGTNRHLLGVYTPHRLESATWNDNPIQLQPQREFGLSVYSQYLEIPSGTSGFLEVVLTGQVDLVNGAYQLDLVAQPGINADTIEVSVGVPDGWKVDGASSVQPTRAETGAIVDEDQALRFEISPR